MNLFENADVCKGGSDACDLVYKLTGNQTLAVNSDWMIGKPVTILGILVFAVATRWVLHKVIDRLTASAADGVMPASFGLGWLGRGEQKRTHHQSVAAARHEQRAKAMGSLLKSVATGVIFATAIVMILSEVGFNVAPLLASAGVLGLALGFGAQSLVKDFLAGMFMIFEDQYGVGDVVDVGEASGTVEGVGLRVTRLRDVDGTVWYVRNGEILRVGNMSQNWARTVLDVPVAYHEDLRRVSEVLRDVAHDLWEDDEFKGKIIEEPEVWGVQSLDPDSVLMRVTLKTAPLEQWAVARTMRERIKARFDYEGIEIPLPQRVVWHRPMSDHDRAAAESRPGAEAQSTSGSQDTTKVS